MPTEESHHYATCKWARFQMSNHSRPRPLRNKSGRCSYPTEQVAANFIKSLPECAVSRSNLVNINALTNSRTIWPDWGKACGVWSKNE